MIRCRRPVGARFDAAATAVHHGASQLSAVPAGSMPSHYCRRARLPQQPRSWDETRQLTLASS